MYELFTKAGMLFNFHISNLSPMCLLSKVGKTLAKVKALCPCKFKRPCTIHCVCAAYEQSNSMEVNTYWVLAQLLGRAGALAAGLAQKASGRVSGTCQAQKRLEQLPLLRQPQLRQRASARLLLEVLAQPPTLQADIQPLTPATKL